jgi:hypothetical protein
MQIGATRVLCQPPNKVVCCVTLVVIAYIAYRVWEQRWYLSLIPADIQTAGALHIGSRTGFIEGCGLAVFRLAPETQEAILREGVQFLEHARQARGHVDAYHSYDAWNATPIAGGLTERSEFAILMMGMSCASLDESLIQQIEIAVNGLGSYYARKPEGGLLVAPKERLVVFAFWG